MKKFNLGRGLLAASIVMALTPSVILADGAMSTAATENTGMTSTTPLPPPKPMTPSTTGSATTTTKPTNEKKVEKKQQKKKKKQNKKKVEKQQADANPEQTVMQDVPAPEDLNSD